VIRVACASNQTDDLHVLAITANFDDLYHTIRLGDGNDWPYPFAYVNQEARGGGPEIVGPTPFCDCALNRWGDLHVLAVNRAGQLYHTIRYGPSYDRLGAGPQSRTGVEGHWSTWGEVQFVVDPLGQALGPVFTGAHVGSPISCATNADGDLHVCVLSSTGRLYHTIRRGPRDPKVEGTWDRWVIVEAFGGSLTDVTCACDPRGALNVSVADWAIQRRPPYISPPKYYYGDTFFIQRTPGGDWSNIDYFSRLLHLNRNAIHNSVSHD
jgi:hypothetical protein